MINTNNPENDKFKGFFHIILGIVYLVAGVLVIYFERTGVIEVGDLFSYFSCALFSSYGIYRIYRGVRRINGKGQGW